MSDEPRKRVLLNDRQVRLFLKDMHTFGYTNLTFEETRRIADEVAAGTHSMEDPVARLMARQIDEAMEAIAERRRPYE
jgi:hypothetical protein